MNVQEQIKLFETLLVELKVINYYSKDNFDTIEGKAKMYVRKFFGDNSHYLEELGKISYSPMIFFGDSDGSYFATSFNSGVKSLCNIITIIIEDLKLSSNYEIAESNEKKTKTLTSSTVNGKRNSINTKEIHVLIATPGDLIDERELLLNSLESKFRRSGYEARCGYRIIVRGWEELASQSGYGQDIIKSQILSQVDIVLAAFKHKLGTPTKDIETGVDRSKSGTAEELLYAIGNKEIKNPPLGMAYFNIEAPKMSFDSPELKLAMSNWEKLKAFKEEIKDDVLYKSFKSSEDLLSTCCEDLVKNIEVYFTEEKSIQNSSNEINPTEADLKMITNYLDSKKFSKITFEGIRKNIHPKFTDNYILAVVEKFPEEITRTKMKGVEAIQNLYPDFNFN
jgi:hypothetical protein